jgi:hypothetical protein
MIFISASAVVMTTIKPLLTIKLRFFPQRGIKLFVFLLERQKLIYPDNHVNPVKKKYNLNQFRLIS